MIKEVAMYKSYLLEAKDDTQISMELGKAYDWASKSSSKILAERQVDTYKTLIVVMFPNEASLNMWEASVQVIK